MKKVYAIVYHSWTRNGTVANVPSKLYEDIADAEAELWKLVNALTDNANAYELREIELVEK
jgi:hypothetical protein